MVLTVNPRANVAALANPIYNPEVDPKTLAIFKLMGRPDDDTIEEYRAIIRAMPRKNLFAGTILNPRACDISMVRTDVDEVKTAIIELRRLCGTSGTSGDKTVWDRDAPGVETDLDQCEEVMQVFEEHTDRSIANLPNMVGMAQGAAGMAGMLGALNPCLGISDMLGSIMEKGKAMMGQVMSQVSALKDKAMAALTEARNGVMGALGSAFSSFSDVMGQVQGAMAGVMGAVQGIAQMVTDEISNMVNSMIDQARQGLSELIAGLPKDPCLSSLMGSIGSGQLGGILGGG